MPDEPEDERHAGDLGNVDANEEGLAEVDRTAKDIALVLGLGEKPVLGRALIVHAQKDDGGQPSGNAGERMGCGTIGIAGQP